MQKNIKEFYKRAKSLDTIYLYIQYLADIKDFEGISRVLETLNISKLKEEEILAYLTVTLRFRNEIPYRKIFFSFVALDFLMRGLNNDILKGLE